MRCNLRPHIGFGRWISRFSTNPRDQNLTVAKLWRAPARQRPAFEDVHEGEQLRLMCCLSFCIVLRATPVILNFGERASQRAAQSNDQVWIAFGARGDLGFPVLEFSRFCVGILLVLALIPDRRLADDLIRQNESALIIASRWKAQLRNVSRAWKW